MSESKRDTLGLRQRQKNGQIFSQFHHFHKQTDSCEKKEEATIYARPLCAPTKFGRNQQKAQRHEIYTTRACWRRFHSIWTHRIKSQPLTQLHRFIHVHVRDVRIYFTYLLCMKELSKSTRSLAIAPAYDSPVCWALFAHARAYYPNPIMWIYCIT